MSCTAPTCPVNPILSYHDGRRSYSCTAASGMFIAAAMAKSNLHPISRFWSDKRGKNRLRDARNRAALRKVGWKLFTVWECWTRKPAKLAEKLAAFMAA